MNKMRNQSVGMGRAVSTGRVPGIAAFLFCGFLAATAQAAPIHDAAKAGKLDALKLIMAQSADKAKAINVQDEQGYSPLHWAVAEGKLEIVPWLLKNGADVALRTKKNETALLLAGRHGRPQGAWYLLQAGANVRDSINPHDITAVTLAAENGHPEVIKVLLAHNADVNGDAGEMPGYGTVVPLNLAIAGGHREVVKLLIAKHANTHQAAAVAIQHGDRAMLDYLMTLGVQLEASTGVLAAAKSEEALIEYLISKGARVDSDIALMSALNGKNANVLKLLLSRTDPGSYTHFLHSIGCDRDKLLSGRTHRSDYNHFLHNIVNVSRNPNISLVKQMLDHDPEAVKKASFLLHSVAGNGASEVVRLLISRGHSVNERDGAGNTPLHLAALLDKNTGTLRTLLEHGADVTARNDWGNTPLHRAVPGGDISMVRLLLDRGAKADATNDAGATPLHMAALRGYTDIARLLVERGAPLQVKNKQGHKPLHAAAASGWLPVVRLLLDNGAGVQAVGEQGMSPLHYALSGQYSFFHEPGHQPTDRTLRWGESPERLETIRLLIERRADVNARTDSSSTPLHLAVALETSAGGYDHGPFTNFKDQMTAIALLLAAGADPNARDNATPPSTALDNARKLNLHAEVINMLESATRQGFPAAKKPAETSRSQQSPQRP